MNLSDVTTGIKRVILERKYHTTDDLTDDRSIVFFDADCKI